MKKSSSSIDADPITLEDIDQCNQFAISMNIDNLVDSENSKVESDNSYHSINQELMNNHVEEDLKRDYSSINHAEIKFSSLGAAYKEEKYCEVMPVICDQKFKPENKLENLVSSSQQDFNSLYYDGSSSTFDISNPPFRMNCGVMEKNLNINCDTTPSKPSSELLERKSAFSVVQYKRNKIHTVGNHEDISTQNKLERKNCSEIIGCHLKTSNNRKEKINLETEVTRSTEINSVNYNEVKETQDTPNYLLKDWKTPKKTIYIPVPRRVICVTEVATQTDDLNSTVNKISNSDIQNDQL